MGTGTNCISSSVVYMHLYTTLLSAAVSIFPSFLSLPMVLCLSVPSGPGAPRDYPVPFRTLLLICRPLFYNSFSHLAACRSFAYRRCERILAVSRDEETTFRESLDSLSSPSRFSLSFFFPSRVPPSTLAGVERRKFMIYVRTGLSGETSRDGYLRENIRTRGPQQGKGEYGGKNK